MREPITHKRQMYDLLTAGRLGNTIPQYGSMESWIASDDWRRYPYWGVRTKTPGGPCRLNCHRSEVSLTIEEFKPHPINISVMISSVGNVTLLGEAWDSPSGLLFSGREHPPTVHDWRVEMKTPQLWAGVSARLLLQNHMNPNSYDDLLILIQDYPGHIIEFSCMDVCFGVLPNRNAITWEVRHY